MARNEDWTRHEVELTVETYLTMLLEEIEGRQFVKLALNRELQSRLDGRSIGSIDFKHGNISAAIIELGLPPVRGYKPYKNYQNIVLPVLEEQLAVATRLREAIATAVNALATRGRVKSILDIAIDPPELDGTRDKYARERSVPRRGQFVNWLEREAANHSLGAQGELLVLEFEDARLRAGGRKVLAERIEHISKTEGDGVGYDIKSFDMDGRERYIEVKTTRYSKYSPFYASAGEVNASEELSAHYHLYRVFSFSTSPGLFDLPGDLSRTCELQAATFRAALRPTVRPTDQIPGYR